MEGMPFTPLEEVGEFALIDRLTRTLPLPGAEVLKGVGDDAAVVTIGEGRVMSLTTDSLVDGTHFDRMYTPLPHLGYKSILVNASDIFAMNLRPRYATVALNVSNQYSVEQLESLYNGVQQACSDLEMDLVGGNVTTQPTGLSINVTVVGVGQETDVVYRKGAEENDLICVSGDLGAAYAGLLLLEREKQVFLENPDVQPDLESYSYVVGRQLKPRSTQTVLNYLDKVKLKPNALMDISDGLAGDMQHLCAASGLGAIIHAERLPIDHQTEAVAKLFERNAYELAFYGGEDYELLFTVPPQAYPLLESRTDISAIGYMTAQDQGIRWVAPDGSVQDLEPLSWDHFRGKKSQ